MYNKEAIARRRGLLKKLWELDIPNKTIAEYLQVSVATITHDLRAMELNGRYSTVDRATIFPRVLKHFAVLWSNPSCDNDDEFDSFLSQFIGLNDLMGEFAGAKRLANLLCDDEYHKITGYVKLLQAIFGTRDLSAYDSVTLDSILNKYFHDVADSRRALPECKEMFFNDILDMLADVVRKQTLSGINEESIKVISVALSSLREREQLVVRYWFGLGQEKKTLAAIGKEMNVGAARVRQILRNAIQNLRHPSRSKMLKALVRPMQETVTEVATCMKEDFLLVQAEKNMEARLPGSTLNQYSADQIKQFMTPVSDLELSVRTANCLQKIAIRNMRIGDLVRFNEISLLKIKDFGRKSLKEINDVLTERRLTLAMDLPANWREEAEKLFKV